MFRRFGKGSEVPEAPDLPECGEHILQWFWDLSARRAPAMAGVSPISFCDIDAWRRLLGVTVRPEEVRAILAMDDAYRRAVNESQKKDKPKPREEPPPKGFLKA